MQTHLYLAVKITVQLKKAVYYVFTSDILLYMEMMYNQLPHLCEAYMDNHNFSACEKNNNTFSTGFNTL